VAGGRPGRVNASKPPWLGGCEAGWVLTSTYADADAWSVWAGASEKNVAVCKQSEHQRVQRTVRSMRSDDLHLCMRERFRLTVRSDNGGRDVVLARWNAVKREGGRLG
jgi:hypothetical protein